RGGRARDYLWCDRRRWARVPVVQRLPGRSLHGRCRCARAWWRARNDRHHYATGDRPVHHGRRVRRRNDFGDVASRVLQIERGSPHFSNGATAPSLRAFGVEGNAGRRSVLDHHDDAGVGWFVDIENSMTDRALVLGLGDSGLAMARSLGSHGYSLRVADTRRDPPRLADARAESLPIEFVGGDFSLALLDGVQLVALSPGLSPTRSAAAPLVKAAHQRKIEVVGEIELFARELARLSAESGYAPQIVGVTGTNGKTTT